jgi:hypothetical protein
MGGFFPEDGAEARIDGTGTPSRERGRLPFQVAVIAGVRSQGELLRLRWIDLSPTLHLAAVPVTKNNEPKHVPLNAEVQAALAALPRSGPTVLAWPWGDPISRITLHYAFRRA